MYEHYFKRFFDFAFSIGLLTLFSPILITIIIILFFTNKGKPFYLQKRPGKNEKLFTIIKLRTMNDKMDSYGVLLSDTNRITKIGKFVRKTSFDELLQLVNVIIGDMSLIGPRPLLIRYLPYYTEQERLRHSVRPGITGLAQISGRNLLDWDSRLNIDITYVENISLKLDLKILIKTVINVIRNKDVEVDTSSAALEDFDEYRKTSDSINLR